MSVEKRISELNVKCYGSRKNDTIILLKKFNKKGIYEKHLHEKYSDFRIKHPEQKNSLEKYFRNFGGYTEFYKFVEINDIINYIETL